MKSVQEKSGNNSKISLNIGRNSGAKKKEMFVQKNCSSGRPGK